MLDSLAFWPYRWQFFHPTVHFWLIFKVLNLQKLVDDDHVDDRNDSKDDDDHDDHDEWKKVPALFELILFTLNSGSTG